MRHTPSAMLAAITVCGLLLGNADAFGADSKIGVASAVKNDVQGRGSRPLSVGSEVFSNERIRTGDAATAQLMFLDKTVMSMGPKAELLLDKFVYNPNRGSGEVVMNAVQGSMRFVTGAQNPTNYAIKTPVATLGIRGTIVDLWVARGETFIGVTQGLAEIRLLNGQILTVPAGKSYTIYANGGFKGPDPYNGSDPTSFEVAIPDRSITDIDQLNAINARNMPPPKPNNDNCYYECSYNLRSGRR